MTPLGSFPFPLWLCLFSFFSVWKDTSPSVYILMRCSGTNAFSQKTSSMSSCSKGTCCGTRLCGTANPLWTEVYSSCSFAWMVPGGSPYTSEAVLVNNAISSLQRIMDIFVFLTSYFLWLGRAVLSFLSNVPELLVDFLAIWFSRGDVTALGLSQVSLSSVTCSVECQDGGVVSLCPKHLSVGLSHLIGTVGFVWWNNCRLTYYA